MKKLLVLMLVLMLVGYASAAITDSFETDSEPDGVPDGWAVYSGIKTNWYWWAYVWDTSNPAIVTDGTAFDGANFVRNTLGSGWWGWSSLRYGPEGGVAVTEGEEYTASFYARGDSTLARLFMRYKDSEGANIDDVLDITDLSTEWTLYNYSSIAPQGAVAIEFTLANATCDTYADFDMVTTSIPEPITIGLLGLGGLFLRRRK